MLGSRDPANDKLKSLGETKKLLGKKCKIDKCTRPITSYHGPNEEVLCRYHQVRDREYKEGNGRIDRPYTYHKRLVCVQCNHDAMQYVRTHERYKDCTEEELNLLARARIHVDHIVARVDGGDDSEENCQSLCRDCHDVKTVRNKDYLKRKTIIDD